MELTSWQEVQWRGLEARITKLEKRQLFQARMMAWLAGVIGILAITCCILAAR